MSTLITAHRSTRPADVDWLDATTPCRADDDLELWFAETPAGVARAQELCGGCPLRDACLAGALERQEPWGVWGGELFERGVPVARKRRPGRPRKDDHLDKRAAERALADRLAGLDLELDQLLATDRLTSGSDADSATRGDDGVAA